MAFRGTFDYSLDAKNRLTVPPRFRTALSDGVVLAKGVEQCVQVWPAADYETFTTDATKDFHRLSPEGRKLRSYFAANSIDLDLDSAGRVGVPPFLLEHGGLEKEVVVVGADDCLEVWDRKRWSDYNATLTDEIATITAKLGQSPS